jgi:hypothetical protein
VGEHDRSIVLLVEGMKHVICGLNADDQPNLE